MPKWQNQLLSWYSLPSPPFYSYSTISYPTLLFQFTPPVRIPALNCWLGCPVEPIKRYHQYIIAVHPSNTIYCLSPPLVFFQINSPLPSLNGINGILLDRVSFLLNMFYHFFLQPTHGVRIPLLVPILCPHHEYSPYLYPLPVLIC